MKTFIITFSMTFFFLWGHLSYAQNDYFTKITSRKIPNKSLHIEPGVLVFDAIHEGAHSAQWLLVSNGDGSFKLRNRWMPDQLLIEDKFTVVISTVHQLLASNWFLVQVTGAPGYYKLKNKAFADSFLDIVDGKLLVTPLKDNSTSSHWKIDPRAIPNLGLASSSTGISSANAGANASANASASASFSSNTSSARPPTNDPAKAEILKAIEIGSITEFNKHAKDDISGSSQAFLLAAIQNRDDEMVSAILGKAKKVTAETMSNALAPNNYSPKVLKKLISNGNVQFSSTNFTELVKVSDSDIMRLVLKENKHLADKSHFNLAMELGKKDIANEFINAGVNVGDAGLEMAMASGNTALAEKLLESDDSAATVENLNNAIRSNNSTLIEKLVRKVEPNSESFVLAAEKGDYDLYEMLTDETQLPDNKSINVAINKNNKQIYSLGLSAGGNADQALHHAVSKNNKDAIEKCLSKKADPKIALNYAVGKADKELLNTLMDKYSLDANAVLDEAVGQMKTDMIEFALLTGNTSPDKHLKRMVELSKDDIAKLMVDNGADPNKGIGFLVTNNKPDMVAYFLEAGADGTKKPLMVHASQNSLKITELLVNAGADPNHGILLAVKNKKGEIAEFLVNNGADPNLAILSACESGQTDVAKLLVEAGADADKGIKVSIEKNHTDIAIMLIENGADAIKHFNVPIKLGNEKLFNVILDQGADPQSGMEAACIYGRTTMLLTLIEQGADGNNQEYMTFAVKGNHASLVPILFDQGVKPNGVYPDGGNYIHKAARNSGGVNTVMKLIEGGVSAKAKDNLGNTPLHIAAMSGKGNVALVEALVKNGCDVNALNNAGETPRKVGKSLKVKNKLKDLGGLKKLK